MTYLKTLGVIALGVMAAYGLSSLMEDVLYEDKQKKTFEAMKIGVALGQGFKDYENDQSSKNRSEKARPEKR